MYDDLILRLRDSAKISEALAVLLPHSEGNATAKLYNEAADAIEELQKRVPKTPHGRLIDADALMLKIQEYIEEYGELDEHGWHNEKWCAMKEAAMSIDNAPAIIEAEEGET